MPADPIVGKKIIAVRAMAKAELDQQGWDLDGGSPVAVVLDDGTTLYASRDEEGNGPGAMFGTDPAGKSFMLIPPRLAKRGGG